MLKIRLKRFGRKNKACYRIVVMESLTRRQGKVINNLGIYNPQKKYLKVNKRALIYYLQKGACPTNVVRHFLCKL
jgi:small subunit ribosomal protein S16